MRFALNDWQPRIAKLLLQQLGLGLMRLAEFPAVIRPQLTNACQRASRHDWASRGREDEP